MAEANLALLSDRAGFTTVVDYINNKIYDASNPDGTGSDRDALNVEYWYDKMLLDKIKLGSEHYVYTKYAQTKEVPEGHQKYFLRRWGSLTAHTTPLIEGIPPKSDKTVIESFEGTFNQYGRYMEFSDKVDFEILDPVIMEYTAEMGDVANRTFERLARNEMLNSTFYYFANNKSNLGELTLGDQVGIADYRLATLQMKRLMVKPLGGIFKVIISEEHKYDLIEDELVREFYGAAYTGNGGGYTAGGGRMENFKDGNIPTLFGIDFEVTMMDDFGYGYQLANPGEWIPEDTTDDVRCRVYQLNSDGTTYSYANLEDSQRTVYVADEYRDGVSGDSYDYIPGIETDAGGNATAEQSENVNRLSDGSWIPIRTIWNLDMSGTDMTTGLGADQATKTAWGQFEYTYDHTGGTVEKMFTLYYASGVLVDDSWDDNTTPTAITTAIGYVETTDGKLTSAAIAEAYEAGTIDHGTTWSQLPVHTSFMIGKEALIKAGISGRTGAKMYVKEKGSAGVLDPINQRQSIGFKIDTVGFNLLRPEACWVFKHVPKNATLTADIGRNHTMGLDKAHNGNYDWTQKHDYTSPVV